MPEEKISLASDHAGFSLKQSVKLILQRRKIDFVDLGTNSEKSVDYPDFAKAVAEHINAGLSTKGILICGSGIGMAITANRFKNIRAAVVHNVFTAKVAAEHNNANVICLGARVIAAEHLSAIIESWLDQPFAGGRHQRRLDKIAAITGE